jgi:hypothetical protein
MFSKFKAALSSLILDKDQDSAMTAEDVLYECQTMSGLTRITQNANGIRILRFGQNGPRQSVVKMGDLDYLGLPYTKAAMIGTSTSKMQFFKIGPRLNHRRLTLYFEGA